MDKVIRWCFNNKISIKFNRYSENSLDVTFINKDNKVYNLRSSKMIDKEDEENIINSLKNFYKK